MKKFLISTVFILTSVFAQASLFKSSVIKVLAQDDLGVKIYVQDKKTESTPKSIYLKNDNAQFENILALLKKSEGSQTELIFTTKTDGVIVIENVSQ